MVFEHPDIDVIKYTLTIAGREPEEVPIKDNEEIHFDIPEDTEYYMTIHFVVKNITLKDLKYKQDIKKSSFVVKSREVLIGPLFEPREEVYVVDFQKDTTPSGYMFRGNFNCTLTYSANGEVLYAQDWTLKITKKT